MVKEADGLYLMREWLNFHESLSYQRGHAIWGAGQLESKIHLPVWGRWLSEVAYKLVVPPSLSVVHPVFRISMTKMYVPGGSHKLQYKKLSFWPAYPTRRRLCGFSINLWRHSVGRKCLSWRFFGHGWELRRPHCSLRMRCGVAFLGSCKQTMSFQGISTLLCSLWLCAIVCCLWLLLWHTSSCVQPYAKF